MILTGISSEDLSSLTSALDQLDAYNGLRALQISRAVTGTDGNSWKREMSQLRDVQMAAKSRGCSLTLDFTVPPFPGAAHGHGYTLGSLLECLNQFCDNIRYLELQVPCRRGTSQGWGLSPNFTLSRCELVVLQMAMCAPAFHNLDHFYGLMHSIEAPKATHLVLEIGSAWGSSLRSVTHAIRRGAWPSLKRITGIYTIYSSDEHVWRRDYTAMVLQDFLRACRHADIEVGRFSFDWAEPEPDDWLDDPQKWQDEEEGDEEEGSALSEQEEGAAPAVAE